MTLACIEARVAALRAEALDVISLELEAADGGRLPSAEAGAHIDLHLNNGLVRHYSLCNASGGAGRYRIGIARSATSRGGSAFLHERIRVGDALRISPPRNNFKLAQEAQKVVLIAGGIGITPLTAMARQCAAEGRDWSLHYCVRSRSRAAFLDELLALPDGLSRVNAWCGDELGRRFDARVAFAGPPTEGAHVYCCGPESLMQAVEAASGHFESGHVHFERFTPPASNEVASTPTEFELLLKRSGATLQVPSDRTVLECLEAHGLAVPFSCREGLCGTCETRVLDGVVDHRDCILSSAERALNNKMMPCVSRAASARLTLDL